MIRRGLAAAVVRHVWVVLVVQMPQLVWYPRRSNCPIAAVVDASSSSSTMLSPYESVRALNKYGNAEQLDHASAAANERGRLIIAVRLPMRRNGQKDIDAMFADKVEPFNEHHEDRPYSKSSAVWIVSPVIPRPVHHRPPQPTLRWDGSTDMSSSIDPLLQAVTSPETPTVIANNNNNNRNGNNDATSRSSGGGGAGGGGVYMVCSGVRADAHWLLQQVRLYGKEVAELYGTCTPTSISTIVTLLKRQFWGYDYYRTTFLPTGSYAVLGSSDDDDENRSPSWGRPLGLRTMILTAIDTTDSDEDGHVSPIQVELIEPSGIVTSFNTHPDTVSFLGMGKHSAEVIVELNKLREEIENATNDSTREQLIATAFAAALSSSTTNSHEQQLHIESITENGTIHRRIVTHHQSNSPI